MSRFQSQKKGPVAATPNLKPEKISCFRKKVLNRELEEVKAYRRQFEVEDDSIRSFKPMKTGSPITPKVHLLKCDSERFLGDSEGGQ